MKRVLTVPVVVLVLVSFVEAQGRGRAAAGRLGGGSGVSGGGVSGGSRIGGGSTGSLGGSRIGGSTGGNWSGTVNRSFTPSTRGTTSQPGLSGGSLGNRAETPSVGNRSSSIGSTLGSRTMTPGSTAPQVRSNAGSGISLGQRSLGASSDTGGRALNSVQGGEGQNLLSQRRFEGARSSTNRLGGQGTGTGRLGNEQRGTIQPGTNRLGTEQRGLTHDGTSGRFGDGNQGRTLPGLETRDAGSRSARTGEQSRTRSESRPQTTEERRSQLNDRLASTRQGGEEGRIGRSAEEGGRRSEARERTATEGTTREFDQQSWQEHRNQSREDWQEHLNQSREDWQQWGTENNPNNPQQPQNVTNNYINNFYYPWYGGPWYPGAYWNFMWDNYPVWSAFQVTAWTLNRAAWLYGYWPYDNPYCVTTSPVVVYDYSQPLVVYETAAPTARTTAQGEPSATALPPGVTPEGSKAFDAALQAFRSGNYSMALDQVNRAVQEMPKDAAVHEFRALVLFALARYDEAAEAIYAVLSVGPGWDWKTMNGLYPHVDVYTQHLRALESYTREQPSSSAARFLLAYHYMTCGHDEAAARQLKKVLELTPGQKVATDILTMLEGPDAVKQLGGAAPPILPPAATVDVPEIKNEQVTGSWQATGPQNSSYELRLNEDGTFRWSFTRDGQTQTVQGVWALDGNVLAMEPNTGGVMLAELTHVRADGFVFRMTGTPPDDPGLNFGRAANP